MTKEEVKILKDVLLDVYEFLDRFVECYKDDEPIESGEKTDAQRFAEKLPVLKKFLETKDPFTIKKPPIIKLEENKIENPNVQEFLECMFGCDDKTKQTIKNHLYAIAKYARESVNPNYRYCVIDGDISECYLTDDIGVAMEFAAKKSKAQHDWRVLSISKCKDGSWRTFVEGWCDDGHYYERKGEEFLHFDYISQRALVVKKI